MFKPSHHYTGLTKHYRVHSTADALALPLAVSRVARDLGFSERRVLELELIASELATNVVHHGGGGSITLTGVDAPAPGIRLTAEDSGPGFECIDSALRDGFSQGQLLVHHIPAGSRGGLGTGLGAIERLADTLDIANRPEGGAHVSVFKARDRRHL